MARRLNLNAKTRHAAKSGPGVSHPIWFTIDKRFSQTPAGLHLRDRSFVG